MESRAQFLDCLDMWRSKAFSLSSSNPLGNVAIRAIEMMQELMKNGATSKVSKGGERCSNEALGNVHHDFVYSFCEGLCITIESIIEMKHRSRLHEIEHNDRSAKHDEVVSHVRSSSEEKVVKAINNLRVLGPKLLRRSIDTDKDDVLAMRQPNFQKTLVEKLQSMGMLKVENKATIGSYEVACLRPPGGMFFNMYKMDRDAPEELKNLLERAITRERLEPHKGGANVLNEELTQWKKRTQRVKEEVRETAVLTPRERKAVREANKKAVADSETDKGLYQKLLGQDLNHTISYEHRLAGNESAASLIARYNMGVEAGEAVKYCLFMVRLSTLASKPDLSSRLLRDMMESNQFFVFVYDCTPPLTMISEAMNVAYTDFAPMYLMRPATTPSDVKRTRRARSADRAVIATILAPKTIIFQPKKTDPCGSIDEALIRIGTSPTVMDSIKYVIKVVDA